MIDELKDFQEGYGDRIDQIGADALAEGSRESLNAYVSDIIGWRQRIETEALDLVEQDFVPVRNLPGGHGKQPRWRNRDAWF